MKFFHLSDLHIGLKLINRDLREDQAHIFSQIAAYAKAEKPDAVVIAGDIFDKSVPSGEAVSLFDEFVESLQEAVPDAVIMMISGNHDSAPRLNVYRHILKKQSLYVIGNPPSEKEDMIEKVELQDEYGTCCFYLLPFVKPSMVRKVVEREEEEGMLSYDESIRRLILREKIDSGKRNILVSHQFFVPKGKEPDSIVRMDSEIPIVGNVDAVYTDMLDDFDYVALGHIHKPMEVGHDRIRYSGTPLACSISEAGQQKGIIMVEMHEKGHLTTRVLPLEPLRQVRIIKGSLEEVLPLASEDYVRVVLTDEVDLDVIDMQDKLHSAFPNLLEIRREMERSVNYDTGIMEDDMPDCFSLCCSFLPDLSEEEKEVLRDVIQKVEEMRA